MDALTVAVAVVAGIGGAGALARLAARRLARVRETPISLDPSPGPKGSRSLDGGVICELRYEVRRVRSEIGAPALTCIVDLGAGHDYPVLCNRPGSGPATGMTMGGQPVPVGDPEFDHDVALGGDPVLLVALLDAATRALVQGLVAGGGWVRDGTVVGRAPLGELGGASATALVSDTLGVAQRLRRPNDLVPRLVRNARLDPQPGVRALNLHVLATAFPAFPETTEALLVALADPEVEIRIEAARRLGPRGLAALRELATSPETPGHLAARAVSLLGDALPEPAAILLLRTARRAPPMQLVQALVEHLARRPSPAALAELRLLLAEAHAELATVVARTLALSGPAAEPILQPALADPRAEVRLAAAASLAQVGSIDSVPLLRQAAEGSPLDRALARATGQAIAAIQARAGGSAGQLALADTSGGALSLASAPTGSLSPADV
ncbi:MAG: hypothetical protein AB2L07_01895 [Thermoanaerobaculaceae bacterium]